MKLGNKIKKIVSIDSENFRIRLKFTDDVVGVVDLSHLFFKPKNLTAEIVKGDLFSKCYIESGSLAWPNGFELCADSLKMNLRKKAESKDG